MLREALLLYGVLLIGPFLVFGMLTGWRKGGRHKPDSEDDRACHS